MDRAFNKPHRLDSDEINVQTDGIVSSYYNPAQDHNVRESQEMQRQREVIERMMRENEERDRRARGASAFEEGLGSSATREDFARRAFDFLVPEGTPVGRGIAEGASLGVEAVKVAANTLIRALATGYYGASSAAVVIDAFMSRFGAADQSAIRAELERSGFPMPSLRGAPAPPPPPPAFNMTREYERMRDRLEPPVVKLGRATYRAVHDAIRGEARDEV